MNEVESMTEMLKTTTEVFADVIYENEEKFQIEAYSFLMKEYRWSTHPYGWRPYCWSLDLNQNWIMRN